MDLVGQTLELSIPGRWGRADRTDVAVRDSFVANKGRPYLQVESLKTGGQYLLTSRYDGDRFDKLEPGRLMAVVIGKLKEGASLGEFTLSRDTEKYFTYYGSGMIQIFDEKMKASREDPKKGGNPLASLRDVFDRWMGRKES